MTTNTDLLVVGATPGGIACAVRAAREGLTVVLTHHSAHLGGMIANGLGVLDTLHESARAPLLDEFVAGVLGHYRQKYGGNSEQFRAANYGPREVSGARLRFEPHVGERLLTEMAAAERRITVLAPFFPAAVECGGTQLRAVTLRAMDGGAETRRVTARVFVDATYEADLAARAGVPYRVGREARDEFNEPHAGRIWTELVADPVGRGCFPREAAEGRLNLRPFFATTRDLSPPRPGAGEGDNAVQAFNFRLCVTDDPANRVLPEKPARYDRAAFFAIRDRWGIGANGPNRKGSWNAPLRPGGSHAYPEADWETRERLTREHRDFALGLLWFLQNDPEVPADLQRRAREFGLARDEFSDNHHVSYEMYVRETRRIVGRYVFTEHDAVLAPGAGRTPVHADSIAVAEWPLDSHECWEGEGKVILAEETRPSQILFRALLPQGVDNLLVPVCLSCTHMGWGTIRLEPTWMHLGESAGFAAAMAVREGVPVAALDVPRLQRTLAENGVMLSFFNDVDVSRREPGGAATQFLGARGFFPGYDARPEETLGETEASEWKRLASRHGAGAVVLTPDFTRREAAERIYAAMRPAEPPPATQPAKP